jgi:hypothetical protein
VTFLHASDTTVKMHIPHIHQKLDLRDRVRAILFAHETGLFDIGAQPEPTANHDQHAVR